MNDNTLTETLKQLTEDAVPAQTDLWPAVFTQLDSRRGAPAHPKGLLTMNASYPHAVRLRWLGIAMLAVLALAAVAFATPQGRALAQSLWRLFTPAAAETFTVPADLGEPVAAGLPTAESPVYDLGACAQADLACQVGYAEEQAGFQALVPAGAIPGLRFLHAVWNDALQEIRLAYTTEGNGSHLSISARRGLPPDVRWDQIAPSAHVQPVMVGGVEAEYVEGAYVVLPGATEATWQPDAAIQRLRWRVGDMVYEIEKWGNVQPVEYLNQAGLIALAESLE